MNITKISYGQTKNVGNYESVRLELTAEVEEDETPSRVYEELRKRVTAELSTFPVAKPTR